MGDSDGIQAAQMPSDPLVAKRHGQREEVASLHEGSESAEVSEESRELNDSNGRSVTQQGDGAHVWFMFVAL